MSQQVYSAYLDALFAMHQASEDMVQQLMTRADFPDEMHAGISDIVYNHLDNMNAEMRAYVQAQMPANISDFMVKWYCLYAATGNLYADLTLCGGLTPSPNQNN